MGSNEYTLTHIYIKAKELNFIYYVNIEKLLLNAFNLGVGEHIVIDNVVNEIYDRFKIEVLEFYIL